MKGCIFGNIAIYAAFAVTLYWVFSGFKKSWWSGALRSALLVAIAAAWLAPGLRDRARFAERAHAEGGARYYGVATLSKGIVLPVMDPWGGPDCNYICEHLLFNGLVEFVEVVDTKPTGKAIRRYSIVRGAKECEPARRRLERQQSADPLAVRMQAFETTELRKAIVANICIANEEIETLSAFASVQMLTRDIPGLPNYFGRHEVLRFEIWTRKSGDAALELVASTEGGSIWVSRIPPHYSCQLTFTGGSDSNNFQERLTYNGEGIDRLIEKTFAINLHPNFTLSAESLPILIDYLSAGPRIRSLAASALSDMLSVQKRNGQSNISTAHLDPRWLAALVRAAKYSERDVRIDVLNVIGAFGVQARAVLPELRVLAASETGVVRSAVEDAIRQIEAAQ